VTDSGLVSTSRAEAGIRAPLVTVVQTCALPILKFALIKSALPSPLTSAAVTERGLLPTPGEEERTKLAERTIAPPELSERFTLRSEERRVGKACTSPWTSDAAT